MDSDGIPSWLHKLFSTALLVDQVESAREWVEMTGCKLMDLLDDDAWTDLVEHLGLRKYDIKRLRKALRMIAPETLSSLSLSPCGEKFAQHKALGSPSGEFPTYLGSEKNSHVDLYEESSVAMSSSIDDAEPEPERLFQSPDPIVADDSTLLISPVKVVEDSVSSPCSLLMKGAPSLSWPVKVDTRHACAPVEEAVKQVDITSPCTEASEFELSSPRKVLARRLLDSLGEVAATSSESQILGALDATFENADDVFAAFESFGPGAVAMFEFDDVSHRFALTADAQNIFKALGISHDQSVDKQGVQHFHDALDSGTIKKQELHQFLETFLGDVPRRDFSKEYEASYSHSMAEEVEEADHEDATACEAESEGADSFSDGQDEEQDSGQSDQEEVVVTVSDSQEVAGAGDDVSPDAEAFASTPSTSIEARVVLADASVCTMTLQKRVVDRSANQRAVIALELREQKGEETELVAQLDVLRILEIRPMTPFSSSCSDSLIEMSFILIACADAVLYLQQGKSVHEVFHSLDAMEESNLSLHVAVGPCASQQAEAKKFFNGLRLLARLPEDGLQRFAAEPNFADTAPSEEEPDAEQAKDEPEDSQESKRRGTLKVDLSHLLRSFGSKSSGAPEPKKQASAAQAEKKQPEKPSPRSLALATMEPEPILIEETKVLFNACHVRWNVVLEAVEARGWTIVSSEAKAVSCNVHWLDDTNSKDVLPGMQPWMRVNHFPGMCRVLGRKCRLAKTMARMQKLFPEEYCFMPRSWTLPEEFPELASRMAKDAGKPTYIVKPDGLSQGRGIFLTDDTERIRKCTEECREKGDAFVVQKYIAKPMLLDGLKFDLRIYLLVVGGRGGVGDDMRMFLFRDGLVRLCTEEYKTPTPETFDQVYKHITNYEVNRYSATFKSPSSSEEANRESSKRSLEWFFQHLESHYGQNERQRVWNDVMSICVKTVLAAQPTLDAEYDACFTKDKTLGGMGCRSFEILGFDVMLNSQRKAFLLEVNHLPSLGCHSALDHNVKRRLVDQTLDLTCGCIDAHITNKSTYDRLVVAGHTQSPSGNGLLDLESYKDFDRVFPPGKHCPDDLAKFVTTISEKVRGVFGSVMSARPRAASPVVSARRSSSPQPWHHGPAPPSFPSPRELPGNKIYAGAPTALGARRQSGQRSSIVRSASAPGLANDKCIRNQLSTAGRGSVPSAWSRSSDGGLRKSSSTSRIGGKASLPSSTSKQSVVRACMQARLSLK